MIDGVEPLITSAAAYPLLERRALAARDSLLFSFRVFDTRTRLRTAEAREAAGGDDWAALLAALAAKGLDVRLQVSDFDPIGGAELHRAAWASLRHLDDVVRARGASGAPEAMAARHPARLGSAWRGLFAMRARREARDVRANFDGDADMAFPALSAAVAGLPTLSPATHHQKVAVIDDDFAIVGGIDVDERRWDTPDHDRPAAETWRDVSLAVYGPRAGAVRTAAEAIWAACVEARKAEDLPAPNLGGLRTPRARDAAPMTDADARIAGDGFSVKLTYADAEQGPLVFGPKNVLDETLQTVLELIRSAKRFLYIETQFLRCREVAEALAEAGRARPELEVVIILPFAPERFAFKGRRGSAIRHAEALQADAIKRVRAAFGDRLAVLSPAKPAERTEDDSFAAHGAGIVYVHSKVMIVDGAVAMVGSANLNDRSLRWDTEVSALWRDAEGAQAFLKQLGDSLVFGPDGPPDDRERPAYDRLETWRAAAAANAAATPDERVGFLLPYDEKRPRRFARRAFWLPNALF